MVPIVISTVDIGTLALYIQLYNTDVLVWTFWAAFVHAFPFFISFIY